MRIAPLLIAAVARIATAQASPQNATVSGTVYDSLARAALGSARVQLVADDPTRFGRVAVSDSLGRFSIDSVPAGRYMVGFFHPMLDSLALEPPLREVVVRGSAPVQANLAIPSPARLRTAFCGAKSDSAGVIVGILRDARDLSSVAGVTVLAEWLELSASGLTLKRTVARSVTTTRENGWFTLCNLPSAGSLALSAIRGADVVDRVDVLLLTGGFARRDLYVGPARIVAPNEAPRADSVADGSRRVMAGEGVLQGVVVNATDGQPVAGAHVRIVDGPQTQTNLGGAWRLTGAPLGTRMLEVRAISYMPDRRTVDVVSNAAPVRVVLSTVKAMLDTVRVAAARRAARDMAEFEERRRTGHGRFLNIDDIAKQRALNTADIFQRIVGMRIDRQVVGSDSLYVRGAIDDWCVPSIWVDGAYMGELAVDDINAVVAPADLTGIELYTGSSTPARFQRGLSGCGNVVIWTKLRNRPSR
jgi:hypothetical protein